MTALVEAERAHHRNREAGRPQRLHHPVLAVDLVGAGQQLAGRLLAQHVAAIAGGDEEGRVGRAAVELADGSSARVKPSTLAGEPGLELRLVEAMVGAAPRRRSGGSQFGHCLPLRSSVATLWRASAPA